MYHYQVGSVKRALQVGSAIFWCLFAAGPMFGFAALKPFLIKEGVYEEICSENSNLLFGTLMEEITMDFNETSAIAPKCSDQDLKLNLIFTVCAVLTNICALPIGFLLDNYGPKLCGLIGGTSIFIGTIIVSNSANITSFDPFLIGFGLVALGGPFTFISSFQLSNAFPKNSGLILALLTGAFDSSSALFLIYSYLNASISNDNYYFSIADFFRIYLFIPIFIFVVQIFLMPFDSYQADSAANNTKDTRVINDIEAIHNAIDENTSLLSTNRRRSSMADITHIPETLKEIDDETVRSGGIFGILHGKTLKEQFKSYWFILLSIFVTLQMLRLNYFISTINSQYTYLFGSHELATKLNKIFDVALPLGGLISIPFVGYLLDNYSTVFVVSTLSILSIVLGVLGCIPKIFFLGVINVLLFVVYRPFFYTTISDITGKVFGFENFGIIYGTVMSISGIVNYYQSYFDKLTHTVFKMNPGPINYILVSGTFLIASLFVGYVKHCADNFGKKNSEQVLDGNENAIE